MVGEPVTISPLANDLSASGNQLRFAKHDQVADVKIVPDFTAGTFSFEAARPGTHYVQYLVTDGPTAADGIVRIDVLAAGATGVAPLATRDTALLQPGTTLTNDVGEAVVCALGTAVPLGDGWQVGLGEYSVAIARQAVG